MITKGGRVVIRDGRGEDVEVGTVVEETSDGRIRVRTEHGDRVVTKEVLVEHLEENAKPQLVQFLHMGFEESHGFKRQPISQILNTLFFFASQILSERSKIPVDIIAVEPFGKPF